MVAQRTQILPQDEVKWRCTCAHPERGEAADRQRQRRYWGKEATEISRHTRLRAPLRALMSSCANSRFKQRQTQTWSPKEQKCSLKTKSKSNGAAPARTRSKMMGEKGRGNVAAEVVKLRTEFVVNLPGLYLLKSLRVTFSFHRLHLYRHVEVRKEDVYIILMPNLT
jgi:hypothetical protein